MLLFWCEFPETVDWEKLNIVLKKFNIKIKAYVAANSRKDFIDKKKRVNRLSNVKVVGAWPILPKKAGYWFSSFCTKQSLNKLDEFKGLPVKVDIEPPIENSSILIWLLKYLLFKKPKTKAYLVNKIKNLVKYDKVIISTFPLPSFILKRLGYFYDKRLSYNFMFYSSFLPFYLKPLYKCYYKFFVKWRLKQDPCTYFALGLLGKGIFGNEPLYKKPESLFQDYLFLKRLNVNNFVIFRLGALTELNKDWLMIIKRISDNNTHL